MTDGRPISQGYEPFPSFRGWGDGYDASVVDEYALALDQARQQVTDEAMEHAVRVATRYAAVDTGAIGDSPALELRVRDVLPTLSTVADLKIDAWCERQVALLIRDADRRAAELAAEAADVPPTT